MATFALQAMVAAVGTENMQVWFEAETAARAAKDGGEANSTTVDPTNDADAMEVETEVDVVENSEESPAAHSSAAESPGAANSRSLYYAYSLYNAPEWLHFALPEVPAAGREAYCKRAVQLLSQLCLVDLPSLGAFAELYSAWATTSAAVASEATSAGDDTGAADATMEPADGTLSAAGDGNGSEAPPELTGAGSSEEKTTDATEGAPSIVAPAGGFSISIFYFFLVFSC